MSSNTPFTAAIDVGAILEEAYQLEQRIASGEILAGVEYNAFAAATFPEAIEVLRRLRRIDLAAPATPVNDALWLSTCAQYEAGDD